MKKIMILGSQGFLGKNIYNHYEKNSHFKAIPINRKDLDLTDIDKLHNIVEKEAPEVVIHTAVSIDNYENNIKMYYALENIAKYTTKVIMIGSGAEYIPNRYQPKMKESYFTNDSIIAKDLYTLSKYTIARLHESSAIENIYNLRVFGVYGPYEDYKRRLISNNIVRVMQGLKLEYGKNIAFDYLYIKDFLSAIDRFINLSKPKENTYNLCIGKSYKFKQILETIAEVMNVDKSSIVLKDDKPSEYEYSGDSSLLESEIGSIERTTLFDAIKELKDWYYSRGIDSFPLD